MHISMLILSEFICLTNVKSLTNFTRLTAAVDIHIFLKQTEKKKENKQGV